MSAVAGPGNASPSGASGGRSPSFAVFNGSDFVPSFLHGINVGITVPGKRPGDIAMEKADYMRWFHYVCRDLGMNVIRVYTAHPPHFYEALKEFNAAAIANNSGSTSPPVPMTTNCTTGLWLVQGIWSPHVLEWTLDAFEHMDLFKLEIHNVVAAVHGAGNVTASETGRAFGAYTADVSQYVLGYFVGTEWSPTMATAGIHIEPRLVVSHYVGDNNNNNSSSSSSSLRKDYYECGEVFFTWDNWHGKTLKWHERKKAQR